MVSVCLPSDALLQYLLSYLGFSYLACGVFLHGCSSKAQLLLLTLDERYLLTATPSDLKRGIAPLGSPVPVQPVFLGGEVAPPGMVIITIFIFFFFFYHLSKFQIYALIYCIDVFLSDLLHSVE